MGDGAMVQQDRQGVDLMDHGGLLFKDGFQISNSGNAPLYPTEQLFNRFKKGNNASEHLGLGLALVKEIVQTSGLQISYTFEKERHVMVVKKQTVSD